MKTLINICRSCCTAVKDAGPYTGNADETTCSIAMTATSGNMVVPHTCTLRFLNKRLAPTYTQQLLTAHPL